MYSKEETKQLYEVLNGKKTDIKSAKEMMKRVKEAEREAMKPGYSEKIKEDEMSEVEAAALVKLVMAYWRDERTLEEGEWGKMIGLTKKLARIGVERNGSVWECE